MRPAFGEIILGRRQNFRRIQMHTRTFAVLAAIAGASASVELAALAQPNPAAVAQEGRTFALEACTGCHIVATDQPFKPIYAGDVRPPDFKDIANKPGATAASLIHYLDTLPAIPKDSHMANADLTPEQTRDVVAYILSLRDKP
jgi:mono/diheme cytochrome c family protein